MNEKNMTTEIEQTTEGFAEETTHVHTPMYVESMTVPRAYYDTLVRTDTLFSVLQSAYRILDWYEVEKVLTAIFGKKPETDNA